MLRKIGSLLALVLILPASLLAILCLAFSLAWLYMLTLGGVSPGDPIFVDELAPSLGSAALAVTISGLALVALIWAWTRARIGWVRPATHASSAPPGFHGG